MINDVSKMKVVKKILYQAVSDKIWGESEVDYVIFLRQNFPKTFNFNTNEVEAV